MSSRSIPRERWKSIQEEEREYHEQKDPTDILEINLRYWSRVLSTLPREVGVESTKRALDLGCGGCGILLAVPPGDHVGIDPLMGYYLEKFPFLSDRKDIRWIEGTAEDLDESESFETVFLINMIDHVFDPDLALRKATDRLAPGGHLVGLLNCHNTSFFRWYFETFHRLIDPHHPFHFRPDDLVKKLSHLELVSLDEIDHLWFPDEKEYQKKVLKRDSKRRSGTFKMALNPFRYPMALSRFLLGRPTRAHKAGEKSLISIYLFSFRKPTA